jgi:beta-lactamase superfamily II metal-dependent hydrolase
MGIRFEFFEAGCGDSILVSTDEGTNILIDGGFVDTYNRHIKKRIYKPFKKNGKKLNLVILTHNDNDHIAGLIKLIKEEKKAFVLKKDYQSIIKEIWFNSLAFNDCKVSEIKTSFNTSKPQLIEFASLLNDKNTYIPFRDTISTDVDTFKKPIFVNSDIQIILLSPNKSKLDNLLDSTDYEGYKEDLDESFNTSDKQYFSNDCNKHDIEALGDEEQNPFEEDTSNPNGSSIAFILIHNEKKYLFLGDAHISLISDKLEELKRESKYFNQNGKIEFEFIKLSHHGSKKNLNKRFLNLIDTNNFIILTNGSHQHHHPDKETLSRIITAKNTSEINFIFNYPTMLKHNDFQNMDEVKSSKLYNKDYDFNLIYSTKYPLD